MARDETLVTLGPGGGVVSGRLDGKVFDLARRLPDRKRWMRGELWFETSAGNLAVLRAGLENATWREDQGIASAVESPAATPHENTLPAHEFIRPPIGKQLAAFEKGRRTDRFGLFMWMGTGKTFVAINLAADWWRRGFIDRVLVLAPGGVDLQWLEEQLPLHAPAWFPWAGVRVKAGRKWKLPEAPVIDGRTGAVWMATNVEQLSHRSGQQMTWDFVTGGNTLFIVDESTRVKTPGALRSKFAFKLGGKAKRGLIMSGQPVTKSLEDLYMQFKVLDPTIIGLSSFYAYRNRYCVMGGYEHKQVIGYRNVDELMKLIEPHCFVAGQEATWATPPQTREHELTPTQKRLYDEIKRDLVAFVHEAQAAPDAEPRAVAVAHAAAGLIKLQQITNGFLYDRESDTLEVLSTARAELCADLVEEAGEQQVIIYCRFHQDLEMVAAELRKRKITFVEYSGRVTNRTERDANLKTFQSGRAKAMTATASSGGIGLNLTNASVTIYYCNTFSLEDREQSKARTDRTGQTRHCSYYDLVGAPVDRLALKSLTDKKTISEIVLGLDAADL